MDTAFYRDKIEDYWGVKPLEGYGGTEIGGIAIQAWNHKGMTFLPDCNFLEFIPEEDFFNSNGKQEKQPRTMLLDEVKTGVYELVITNFHGNVFTRYRTGDLVEIISLRDDELSIDIPQMSFYARGDGVIDVSGFTRLTEKSVYTAIYETKIPCVDWTIRKEYQKEKPILHLYFESKNGYSTDNIRDAVHEKLKEEDSGYADLENMLGVYPLQVTNLPSGAFNHYMDNQRQAGADMAHIKPPRVNATDKTIELLKNGY